MDHFRFAREHDQPPTLVAESVGLERLAGAVGTPAFVYSRATMAEHVERLRAAFEPIHPTVCYAVKAANNIELLRVLVGLGCGMDVVSGGELERAWAAGCPMDRVVFAGVGKTAPEIAAALDGRRSPLAGSSFDGHARGASPLASRGPIKAFNCESASELALIAEVAAQLDTPERARVAIRVNPGVDARTHAHTTTAVKGVKFGVSPAEAIELFDAYRGHARVELLGLHAHLGSPMYDPATIAAGVARLLELLDAIEARGHRVRQLDIGGGIGADYQSGQTPAYADFAREIIPLLEQRVRDGLEVIIEPGRTIMEKAGVLLTRVQHIKHVDDGSGGRDVVVCDAGMNLLLRPALYNAFHFIWPVTPAHALAPVRRAEDAGVDPAALRRCDIVGPICETGDFLARGRLLPPLGRGDLLCVFSAGAYAMSMASTYNDHPLPAEVLVDGGRAGVIRQRQHVAQLLSQGRVGSGPRRVDV